MLGSKNIYHTMSESHSSVASFLFWENLCKRSFPVRLWSQKSSSRGTEKQVPALLVIKALQSYKTSSRFLENSRRRRRLKQQETFSFISVKGVKGVFC